MSPVEASSANASVRTPAEAFSQPSRLMHRVILVLAACMLSSAQSSAVAEISRVANSGTFLPSNRLDARGIQRAEELIAAGEYSQSIRFLDEILSRQEDSFVANESGEHYGLKETARQLLKGMPADGSRIYETTFGPVARRLLKQSTEEGDVEKLRQITQRYFHTPAGHEAALLFAQSEADQGRHLTAALTYDQLLESDEALARFEPQLSVLAATSWLAANNAKRAAEILQSLSERGVRTVQLAGEDYPVHQSRHAMVEWLVGTVGDPASEKTDTEDQWLTTRGNAARNGKTDGGLPHLRVRWQVRLLEHHKLEAVHDEMASLLSRQEKSKLPAAVPLAAGDYIITRTPHGLLAIDFKTGKRVWRAKPQRVSALQGLLDGGSGQNENDIAPAHSFAQTLWEDYLYSTTSSDGERVFVIRDLVAPTADRSRVMPFWQRGTNINDDHSTNRLCAYDLATQGKLVWEIDGAARTDQLRGAFFLGAPVTVGQSLYCLTEIKSDTAIYLVALDRKTGELQWRQQLVDLERSVALDMNRRLQASMPSYEDGMLVCPTGSGVVVGVDLAKQALAWAYSYANQAKLTPRQLMMQRQSGAKKPNWVHSAPVIADGRILLTPADSDQLHCLDLLTGKLLWKKPRKDAQYLAGVDRGNLLLVGNQKLTALRLADGESAWTDDFVELPGGSSSTGTGFFNAGQYFLPLSNATVVAIDTKSGAIRGESSSRDGQILGNLICYRGSVISQTGRNLDRFDQIDVLRAESEQRRKENPGDYEALRTLGEIAYNDGQIDEALELLIQAHEASPADLRTREVLAEALVAALDEDYQEHRTLLTLLAEIQEPTLEAQLTLMRLKARGLQELGQVVEAFDVCVNAYRQAASMEIELTIGQDHQVRATRWLARQVADAWTSADLSQRDAMSDLLAPLLTEVENADDHLVKQGFYDCFSSTGLSSELAIDLAKFYLSGGNTLQAQQILVHLTDNEDRKVRSAAIALSSRLLHEAETPFLAATYDHILRTELADEPCLDGKNGLQCLAQWAGEGQKALRSWPYGLVEVETTEPKSGRPSGGGRPPTTGVLIERTDEVLANCNVRLAGMMSGRNRILSVQDSLGRNFYNAKIDQRTRGYINTQMGVYAVTRGNLLILSLGRQVVAFDTLSDSARPLWRKDTTSNLHYVNRSRTAIDRRLGRHQSPRVQANGHWMGVLGPVTRDSCIFQIEERLVCVDSLTGEERWSRDNIPLGCDLFGDEEYVFAVPKDSKQALVFSTVDGRSYRETDETIPSWQERLLTNGRKIVRWRRRLDRRWELSASDPLRGETLWKFEFEKNSRVDVAQGRYIAVAEPTGHCTIIDAEDGAILVDEEIQPNLRLDEVHFLAGSDKFIVGLREPLQVDARIRHVRGFNTQDFTKPFAGQLYVFDRNTGRASWSRSAEIEGLPLMLEQPVDLPVVVFAGNIQRRDAKGSKQEIGVMLLEKATGRLLYHNEKLPASPHYCSVSAADNEKNEVVIEMINTKINVKFTDKPRAPEPPAMSDVQRDEEKGVSGLREIGNKLFRGL